MLNTPDQISLFFLQSYIFDPSIVADERTREYVVQTSGKNNSVITMARIEDTSNIGRISLFVNGQEEDISDQDLLDSIKVIRPTGV